MYNAVENLELYGNLNDQELPAFIAQSRSLSKLELAFVPRTHHETVSELLTAIANPSALSTLKIFMPANQPRDFRDVALPMPRFVNLKILRVPGDVCTADFITSLSKLAKLSTLGFALPGTPDPAHIHALLYSHDIYPSLKGSTSLRRSTLTARMISFLPSLIHATNV